MHENRRAVLLLDTDGHALRRHPLVGAWVCGGIGPASAHKTLIWAAAARFLTSSFGERVLSEGDDGARSFLLAFFPGGASNTTPRFYVCSVAGGDYAMPPARRAFDFCADVTVDLSACGNSGLTVVGRLKPAVVLNKAAVADTDSAAFSRESPGAAPLRESLQAEAKPPPSAWSPVVSATGHGLWTPVAAVKGGSLGPLSHGEQPSASSAVKLEAQRAVILEQQRQLDDLKRQVEELRALAHCAAPPPPAARPEAPPSPADPTGDLSHAMPAGGLPMTEGRAGAKGGQLEEKQFLASVLGRGDRVEENTEGEGEGDEDAWETEEEEEDADEEENELAATDMCAVLCEEPPSLEAPSPPTQRDADLAEPHAQPPAADAEFEERSNPPPPRGDRNSSLSSPTGASPCSGLESLSFQVPRICFQELTPSDETESDGMDIRHCPVLRGKAGDAGGGDDSDESNSILEIIHRYSAR